jgi:hypothetical protein
MLFRVEYTLRDLDIAENETLEFSEDSPQTRLVIRRPSKDENPRLKEEECVGAIQTEEPVTEKVRPQFDLGEPGTQAVLDIGSRVFFRIQDFVIRAVGVMRWRRGITGHLNFIVSTQGMQCSDNGQDWKYVPGSIRLMILIKKGRSKITEEILSSVRELFHDGKNEPLGHELFLEAWEQRNEVPRSSLMIGLTAAEVGFKMFVADLVPHAEWLALHAPTPPLVQMLTEYLPKLPVRQYIKNFTNFVPKNIIDTLKKGVKLRNETAHAGGDVTRDTLEEILKAVRDLLYLLDLYAGQSWALQNRSATKRWSR